MEECLKHGNRREAAKYVARVGLEERFDMYMKIEEVTKKFIGYFLNFFFYILIEIFKKEASDQGGVFNPNEDIKNDKVFLWWD